MPLLTSFLLVCFLWPGQKSFRNQFLIKAIFAAGLAFGISSCTFFIWLVVFGSPDNGYIITETALFSVLCLVLIKFTPHHNGAGLKQNSKPILKGKLSSILSVGFCIVLICAVGWFVLTILTYPHGGWDAWSIWNMRARILFRGGDQWANAFSNLLYLSQPDYPLLISASIARFWVYIGKEAVIMPQFVAMLFTFTTIGLLIFSLAFLRNKNQGILAGLVLLSIISFVGLGASQYADIPLSFFILATIVLLLLQTRASGDNRGLLCLAGAMASLSAWTKNEGILFFLLVILVYTIVVVLKKGWRPCFRETSFFVKGAIPMLLILIYFKIQFAPANQLFANNGFHLIIGKLLDFSRYLQVGKAFVSEFFRLGFGGSLIFVLLIYFIFSEIRLKQKDRLNVIISGTVLCFMFIGYFFIFIISPEKLDWQLDRGLYRLFLQLWPAFVFIFFFLCNTRRY